MKEGEGRGGGTEKGGLVAGHGRRPSGVDADQQLKELMPAEVSD